MSRSSTVRRIIGIVAWLVAFHVLLAYGLPEGLFIALVLGLGVLYWRGGALAGVTVSITLLLVTLVYGLALRLTGFESSIYYRPDEKYLRYDAVNNHMIYQKNVSIEMLMPHGDLRAMTKEEIAEPRTVRFHTDQDGFRNDRDYSGQKFVLVGDSFIAGSSNSQEDMLTAQLAQGFAIDAYTLACPGTLADYAAYVQGFAKRHGENFRVLLFIFEGNDFEESRGRRNSSVARYGRRYYEMFSEFNTYRVTKSLLKRVTRARSIQAGSNLEIAELGGKKMAFYRRYVNVTRQTQPPQPEGFEHAMEVMRPYIERVYFIPTKYRVYSRYLNSTETLPHAQWRYLQGVCQKYQLHCTDLTAPLMRESEVLLKKGEFTWWRDDTHWNRHGIAVAARVVAADFAAVKSQVKR